VQLPPEDAAGLEKTKSADNTFTEKSPYTVTYSYTYASDGISTGPQTFQLPILYTVWPAGKPLPDDLEYVVDYNVFLPPYAKQANSTELLQALENEALAAAFGVQAQTLPPVPVTKATSFAGYISGNIRTYDNSLGGYAPMANLKVTSRCGSYTLGTGSTNSTGNFNIASYVQPSPASSLTVLSVTYQDLAGKWYITPSSTTTPFVTTVTNISSSLVWAGNYNLGQLTLTNTYQENTAHRAANYFYNVQTDFTRSSISGGIHIITHNTPGKGLITRISVNGQMVVNSITIYKGSFDGSVIGSTLWGLGHFALFKQMGNTYNSVPSLLRESFAAYSAWYLGEKYYLSQGATPPTGYCWGITGDYQWQHWGKDYSYGSSPIYIDLTDTYNQKTMPTHPYPNDEIQGVPASAIWYIASTSATWAQCRSKLQSYVGTYYTSAQFNNWIADFDYWFANHI
jgi:hypothetical protein